MAFESVNVHNNPEAQARLRATGIAQVPVTQLGDKLVQGWNPQALAELVGVDFDGAPALSPVELAECLDGILYRAQHLIQNLPQETLPLRYPGRDRDLKDLGFHIFRVAGAFVDCLEQGQYLHAWHRENAPETMLSGVHIAEYGQAVRNRLTAWFEAADDALYAGTAHTYYGPVNVHQLLERVTWHTGQHLRQIYDLLEQAGQMPTQSLPMALFDGLPMPEALW